MLAVQVFNRSQKACTQSPGARNNIMLRIRLHSCGLSRKQKCLGSLYKIEKVLSTTIHRTVFIDYI